MAYLKLNDIDFSTYVNSLKVGKSANYNSQTNANGDTVVDFINSKKVIEVGIIPLDTEVMATLQSVIDGFNVSVSYRNPDTNVLDTINCIIPSNDVEYYTIQIDKVMYKAFTLQFIEL